MTKESSYSTVPGDQIPVELMKEFPSFSVTLAGLRRGYGYAHCGSGTLVRFEDRHFILTAAHCARALTKFDEIGLPIRRDTHPFTLPILNQIYIGEWECEEWGPDLAFLPVPNVKARDIVDVSNMLFYDLGKYRDEMLGGEPKVGYALWVVIGTPAHTCNLKEPTKLEFTKMTYSGGVEPPVTRGEFDYIEIRAALDRKEVPPNFKGVSGGGLWHTDIGRKRDGTFVTVGKPRLEGCAFYETSPRGEYVYIRCHGRRSIYEHGISKIMRV